MKDCIEITYKYQNQLSNYIWDIVMCWSKAPGSKLDLVLPALPTICGSLLYANFDFLNQINNKNIFPID